ncbi:MAG TPA: exodeoxyribonuclease V subunit gamma [Pseudonocardia sp.]|nr:exodeoxyribonuclease V subunit gamma [Pseudonocardia sp.]
MTERTGGLVVHRAERADALAGALAELIAVPLPDPFATEVVAVPAKGVERWLAQQLSHRLGATAGAADGVCAGVDFPSPAALLAGAVAAATGTDPDSDPWDPARLAWPLLEVIDAHAGEPWCAALAAHLGVGDHCGAGDGSGARRGRRYGTARRLAELFAGYAAHRPQLLSDWTAGAEVDGDLQWQPRLWRGLRERVGRPDPAERLATACTALAADPGRAALPDRLSLFGPTRLPAAQLAVLTALATHRAVHLWLPHPSPALWDRVTALLPTRATTPRRAADPTADAARHPLLSSLARDVRELQLRLAAAAPDAVHRHHPAPDPPPTLLGRLQRRLRDDRPPDRPEPIDGGDHSVQVHACHGPHRQVEVLRELLVGLLSDDPTLEPRDILVMCPDVETFAPLISAAFGLGDGRGGANRGSHPGQRLQVRLADRALRQVNPLLATVATLLELADARVTTAQALDLLASAPVRLRFRLDDADLDRLRLLAVRAGVRWGLSATDRGRYRLEGYRQGTWAAGLDRLLLGVAMSGAGEPGWLGTALPMAEVDSGDTAAIGGLAEFLDRLAGVLGALSGEQPLNDWLGALDRALDLLTDTVPADAWQLGQARAELAAAGRAAGPHADTVALRLADVRDLLAERLRGRPTRAGFRTGTITVATLVPMRSVPHRVICLLGLDDGVFPRAAVPDGDDLLARDPLAGERDARSEDRQLLLDAICAATERLVVVHSGADERSGARRPPAVPLGELLDAIETEAGVDGRDRVIVRHPLQPFHARNFVPGAMVADPGARPRAFSYDRTELAGALSGSRPRSAPAPFLPAPLAAPDPADHIVALDDLTGFLEHPVKGFLRQRVGVPVTVTAQPPGDALPVQLDGLATWAIGDRLLRDRLAGHPLDRCRQAEWRRGELPPGALGDALLTTVLDDVEPLVAVARPGRAEPLPDRDVDVELSGGARLIGTIDDLYRDATGPTLLRVEFSRLAPKQRIRAWVRLLALAAATGEPWRAVTVGRGTHHGLSRATLGPMPRVRARELLGELVALRASGLTEPLPLPTVTGYTYARSRQGGADAAAAAEEAMRKWSGGGAGAECLDDAHRQVWGPAAGPEVLLARPGPAGGEPTRFGTLALALWMPMLLAEDMERL